MTGIINSKRFLIAASLALTAIAAPAFAADVGVSVSIGEPGFYGRIDIGDFPRPVLVYPEPVVIHRPVGVVYEPIYLHVPPGQAKRWRHYCGRYDACGRPVYFVQDHWYNDVYVPKYRERHGGGRDRDRHGDDHGRDYGHGGHEHGRGEHGRD